MRRFLDARVLLRVHTTIFDDALTAGTTMCGASHKATVKILALSTQQNVLQIFETVNIILALSMHHQVHSYMEDYTTTEILELF